MARNTIEFTERGEEILDSRPIEVPLNFQRPLTLQEEIRRMIAVEASHAADVAGLESFQEADDFEIDDEEEPFQSAYEITEMIPDGPSREDIDPTTSGTAGQESPDPSRNDGQNPSPRESSNGSPEPARGPGEGNARSGGTTTPPVVD